MVGGLENSSEIGQNSVPVSVLAPHADLISSDESKFESATGWVAARMLRKIRFWDIECMREVVESKFSKIVS